MKNFDCPSSFYNEVINLIDFNNYKKALKCIKKNLDKLDDFDDIALAYLNCGFLNDKLGDDLSAIDDFSNAIFYESKLNFINKRSKEISFNGRSNSRYKNGEYKGAIEDKMKAKKIRLIEIDKFLEPSKKQIDYKDILLGTFFDRELEPKYNVLIKASKIEKSKYDLIEDYKKVINNNRKDQVIRKLELLSESKYQRGDYKGSIRAIRRSEKYYE